VVEVFAGAVDNLAAIMEQGPRGHADAAGRPQHVMMDYLFRPGRKGLNRLIDREITCHMWEFFWPGASVTGLPIYRVACYELEAEDGAEAMRLVRRLELLELQGRLSAGIIQLEHDLAEARAGQREANRQLKIERQAQQEIERLLNE